MRNKLHILPPFPKTFGSAKDFRDWDIKMEAEYPIRFKIAEMCDTAYNKLFLFPKWRLRDAKWKVIHRFHPKHRYHVIKPRTLQPGYHDPSELVLHGPFEVFARFFELAISEKSHTQWDYSKIEPDEQHGMTQEYIDDRQVVWDTMNELYYWWMSRQYRERELPALPEIPDEWGILAIFNEDFNDTEEVIEWQRISDIHRKMESRWKKQDQDMLHKLIDIREYLWD